MLKESVIQFNKFAELNNENIIFSKTDFILNAFSKIKECNSEISLITGNSDYCIFYEKKSFIIKDLNNNVLAVFKKDIIPLNLKYWFAVNNCTNLDFIKSLPMGIENDYHCIIEGHGHGWEHAKIKKELLSNLIYDKKHNEIDKYIYCNFELNSNYNVRKTLLDHCKQNNIYTESIKLNYAEYVNKCKQFKAVLCPIGNGLDTHRFYEILLMHRIPILIKKDNYKIYDELFSLFPCIILDDMVQLLDKSLENKIDNLLSLEFNPINFFDYWKTFILKHIK